MRKVTITEEEWDNWVASFEGNDYSLVVSHLEEMRAKLFPPLPQWIFGREPTREDADENEDVAMPDFLRDSLWIDRHYDLLPEGVPFMKLPEAEVYTTDNPAPNPFESNSQKQKQ